jgi:hypothetical protein
MGTYQWQTFSQDFSSDGTTPLVQNGLNLFTIDPGSQIKRTIFKVQLSCQVESSVPSTAPLDFVPRVRAAAGVWLGNTAIAPATSPTPITDANSADWLMLDFLQERCDVNDLANTQLTRLVWETPPAGVDVQSRRNAAAGISNDLWVTWEIIDPDNIINTSGGTYNAYLGGWFGARFLIYTP